ncbi:MAG: tetratricopeptide repeat protein [Gemmatimonadota bacterium]|nr:tetratricopeptide repeat protein [Gemmatimonadota bacterium]
MDGPLNRFAKEPALLLGAALALCSACAELRGESPAPAAVASVHSERIDYHSKTDQWRQVLRRDPSNREAHIRLAGALLEEGAGEAAIAACRAGLAVDSTLVPLYGILAAVYAREGRYMQAIDNLEKAVKLQPDYAVGYANLGGMFTKLGRYEQAEQSLERARDLAPERPSIHRRLGELYLNTDRPQAAARQFEQAARLNPDEGVVFYLAGKASEALGHNEEAWQAYRKAVQLDISLEEALFRVAVLGRRLGYKAEADSALQAFHRLRQIDEQGRDLAIQKHKFRTAVLNTPENPSYHYDLGVFFARLGYHDEAVNKFDRVLQMRPEDFTTMTRKGNVLAALGKTAAALEFYGQALRLAPDFPPAHISAAHAYMQMNRPRTALEHYAKAVELVPEAPVIWYQLAKCQVALKQLPEAETSLETGLQRATSNQDLRLKLEALLAKVRNREGL